MFVPLTHAPGEAQADFGEALVIVGGVECKAHYLAMDLPQSDDCFVMAFPAETTEAFLEGHMHAFAYFGGVPRRDSVRQHEAGGGRILGGGDAEEDAGVQPNCRATICLQRSSDVRARATTREKWKGLVGYARRNFLVPVPRFD